MSIYLKDAPKEAALSGPVALFALLQHEHKVTVLNFAVQRDTEYDASVRSKVGTSGPLTFQNKRFAYRILLFCVLGLAECESIQYIVSLRTVEGRVLTTFTSSSDIFAMAQQVLPLYTVQ